MSDGRRYDIDVIEVHSGDDLVILVNLGVDGLYKRVRARLKGVDTPSAFKASKGTEAGAIRDTLRSLVSKGKCQIDVHSQGKGGWIVTLLVVSKTGDETNVNEAMRQQGYVYPGKQD